MATDKTREVLEEVATRLTDAEAQLPVALELIAVLKEANEPTTEVQTLVTEIKARIVQWRRVLTRRGINVPPPPETPEE